VKLFDTACCSPLVLEGTLLLGMAASRRAEVSAWSSFIFRNLLFSKMLTLVVSLVFVVLLDIGWHAAGLWQAPSGEVFFSGGVCRGLRHVSARAYLHRRSNMQLKAVALATVSSKAKCIESTSAEFRLVLWLVLSSARIAFKRGWRHLESYRLREINIAYPWLCANLWSANTLFPSQVSVDRIIKEHIIFIVVKLGLDRAHFDLVSERIERFLKSNTGMNFSPFN